MPDGPDVRTIPRTPQGSAPFAGGYPCGVTPVLELAVPAEAAAPAQARRAVRAWLANLCGFAPLCDTGDDLTYAVSEAVSNCVDHAYPGTRGVVRVVGRSTPAPGTGPGPDGCSGGFQVELTIADTGRWKDSAGDPGDRGRGMQMIDALVDVLEVIRGRGGTAVVLRHRFNCVDRAG